MQLRRLEREGADEEGEKESGDEDDETAKVPQRVPLRGLVSVEPDPAGDDA